MQCTLTLAPASRTTSAVALATSVELHDVVMSTCMTSLSVPLSDADVAWDSAADAVGPGVPTSPRGPGSPLAPGAPVAPVVPVAPVSPLAPFSAETAAGESLARVTALFLSCLE